MDNNSQVITCKKLKPTIHPSLWCRSCTLNLKKRCTGVTQKDEENVVPPENSSLGRKKRARSEDLAPTPLRPMATSIDEKWVQCEGCDTWRRLPDSVDTNSLPEKWYCWMNIWDSLGNKCVPAYSGKVVESRSPRPASAPDFGTAPERFKRLVSKKTERTMITPTTTSTLNNNTSLAEVLGLKTVEKVKELCRSHGVRTTRAGTNGGRKSKGELIQGLIEAGLTHLDESFDLINPSTVKARRRRFPLQFTNVPGPSAATSTTNMASKVISQSPLFAAAAVVEARDAPHTLDSLAEAACTILGLSTSTDENSNDSFQADFPTSLQPNDNCVSPTNTNEVSSRPPQCVPIKPFNVPFHGGYVAAPLALPPHQVEKES